MENKEDILMTC